MQERKLSAVAGKEAFCCGSPFRVMFIWQTCSYIYVYIYMYVSGFNTDCMSFEPLKSLVMLCYVVSEMHNLFGPRTPVCYF